MMTSLIFLLDRSGSMEMCWDDTIGGFNAFVADQKNVRPEDTLTLVQFDHEIIKTFENVKLHSVQPLTRETFVPRGTTALLDAIGSVLTVDPPSGSVLFIILTDGEENASKTYTKAHIKDLMKQKQKDGWSVMYLGANQDAFAEAGSIGIAKADTLNYDPARTPELFHRLSQTVTRR